MTAGTYLVIATGSLVNAGTVAGDCYIAIKSGGTIYGSAYAGLGATDYYADLSVIALIEATATATISLVAKVGQNSASASSTNGRTQLAVLRVG